MGSNCICCGAAAADGIGSRGECFLANGVGEAVKEEQVSQSKILQVVLVSPQVLQTSSFLIFWWLTEFSQLLMNREISSLIDTCHSV